MKLRSTSRNKKHGRLKLFRSCVILLLIPRQALGQASRCAEDLLKQKKRRPAEPKRLRQHVFTLDQAFDLTCLPSVLLKAPSQT